MKNSLNENKNLCQILSEDLHKMKNEKEKIYAHNLDLENQKKRLKKEIMLLNNINILTDVNFEKVYLNLENILKNNQKNICNMNNLQEEIIKMKEKNEEIINDEKDNSKNENSKLLNIANLFLQTPKVNLK